ncbi:hypothetical protein [uncultured Chitinophaga sp.]|uniref:hypothetical protein n=1 Tax=uncultured Chitinophaga sp. TaxID=339340 RepID=UPI00263145F4|nr:hypothetical protein [uncultured Chitinophaga sp.]
MSKQRRPVYITGTVNGICYYKMNGRYYARRKSSLSRKRVKRDPAFRLTRKYAGLLGQASRIAVGVYRLLPRHQKKIALYRAMTGKAMALLKQGADEASIREHLQREANLLKTADTRQSAVCIRERPGTVHVIKSVWRRSGKGIQHSAPAPAPHTGAGSLCHHEMD